MVYTVQIVNMCHMPNFVAVKQLLKFVHYPIMKWHSWILNIQNFNGQ